MEPRDTAAVRARARLPVWRRLAVRLGASFLLLTAIGIFLSGFLQYRAQDRYLRQSLGSLLLNIARTGALLVDPALHATVETTRTQDSEAYRGVRAKLAAIQDENRIETPIYTLTGFDGAGRQARFMVTAAGPDFRVSRIPSSLNSSSPWAGRSAKGLPRRPGSTATSRGPGSRPSRRSGIRTAGSSLSSTWTIAWMST